MTILVTGANGFVGAALCASLEWQALPFRAVTRANSRALRHPGAIVVGEIDGQTDWADALQGVQQVVHLAARVHVMQDRVGDPLAEFHRVNVEGTAKLARQAAECGVRRFVFVSSIKVNGEGGQTAYSEFDTPHPADPYAISKWEAEQCLQDIAAGSGMEVVIVRPPLVYGPGVKANFLGMMRWLSRGVPLPLGAIHNKRSLVALGNLVDFLITCVDHPAAANQTFLVCDGEDLSTTDLLVRMAAALGEPARLMPVPAWMLTAVASVLGKRDLSQRLCGSLRVDISKARDLLGWSPPVSVDEGLRRTAEHYLAGVRRSRW